MMVRFLTQNRNPIRSFFVVRSIRACASVFDQLNLENNVCYIDDIEIYYLAIIKSHESWVGCL